jgi:biopolymer transport protein ExbB
MFLRDLFVTGGPVMWPLLFFSIATVAMTVERTIFWSKLLKNQVKVVRQVTNLYRSDPHLAIEKLGRHLNLPIPRIFHQALSVKDADADEFGLMIDSAIQAEVPTLQRFNDLFDLTVGLAPLLGLLGTVTGLIRSLSGLDMGGGGNTAGVTLIATAFGLIVAIFAFIVATLFRSLCTRQLARIQENVAELEFIHRRRRRNMVEHV